MSVEIMDRSDLEMMILENDIVDVMELPDDITIEELRDIVRAWVVAGDETHESCG